MLRLSMLAAILFATPAFAAATLPPLGNGYGAMDAPRDVDSVGLAQMFCEARIAGDMAALAPYFSDKLRRLLDRRAAGADAEDVPWQSRTDRPTGCTLEVLNGAERTIGVLVRVTFTSASGTWSDTLNLERTPTSWRLDNVFYEDGGNLRFRLFQSTDG